MKELKKPFIGVAYYPEDWPESVEENGAGGGRFQL